MLLIQEVFPAQITNRWILSQIFSFCSFGFIFWSFQLTSRKKLLLCMLFGAFLNGVHFCILQKYTAGADILVIMVAIFLAQRTERNDRLLRYVFAITFLIITYFIYEGYTSILSCIASILSTHGMFRPSDKVMRQILFGATTTWIIHNALIQSPMSAFKESCILVSSIVGYVRKYVLQKKQKPVTN